VRDDSLGAIERAAQVDRHDAVPIRYRHRRDRLTRDHAGRVDQHVDAAFFGGNVGGEPGERRAIGNIEFVTGGPVPALGRDLPGRVAVAIDDHDPRSGTGEFARAGRADTIATAGRQDNFPVKPRAIPIPFIGSGLPAAFYAPVCCFYSKRTTNGWHLARKRVSSRLVRRSASAITIPLAALRPEPNRLLRIRSVRSLFVP
jgi:hypothetical protein